MAKKKKRKKKAKRKTTRRTTRKTTRKKTKRKATKRKTKRKSTKRKTTKRKVTKKRPIKRKKKAAPHADVKIYKKSGRPVMIVAKGVTPKGKLVIKKCTAMRKARGGKVPIFNGGICCKPAHAASVRAVARKMGARTKTIAVTG